MPTRSTVPAFASSAVSSVNAAPSASCTGPSRKHSMRIFGPPRSSSTPMQRSQLCAAWRAAARRRMRSSTVPCEALSRTTSSPARIMSVSTPSSSVAGPSVATILVRLSMALPASSGGGPLFENGDRRQRLAFHELEERAAAGRHVGNPVLHAVFLDGGERIAAAGERERLAARDAERDGARALAELLELEHPDRTVPDDGAGGLDERGATIGAVGTDVEDHLIGPYLA